MEDPILDKTLRAFSESGSTHLLLSGKWGFEREALRVDADGNLAATDHPFPPERGDITVDFGENQIELVTTPAASAGEALAELRELQAQAYEAMGEEYLWPLSVPGKWDRPELFRPAGFSGVPEREGARAYRRHLMDRYGRARQAISGLHFNFSLSGEFWAFLKEAEGAAASGEGDRAYADRRYLDLSRNLLRYRFLPIFLFSASPALDPRFEAELRSTADPEAQDSTAPCSGRTASLRMGPLGYRMDPRRGALIDIRFASIGEYLDKLEAACSPGADGRPPLLESAAEYYAPIRPKAAPRGPKGSLAGLRERGIEYLELRFFDLDPLEPAGIGAEAVAFTQLLALACLLMPSPPLAADASSDDFLSIASSSCSFDRAGEVSDRRLRAAVSREAGEPLGAMRRIAPLMGRQYEKALRGAEAMLAGRKARPVERFARLALLEGGGFNAGLKLAWRHREDIMRSRKEAS